jgi:hypothetical protein
MKKKTLSLEDYKETNSQATASSIDGGNKDSASVTWSMAIVQLPQ